MFYAFKVTEVRPNRKMTFIMQKSNKVMLMYTMQ